MKKDYITLKNSTVFNFISNKNIRWMNDKSVTLFLGERTKTDKIKSLKYFLNNRNSSVLLSIYFKEEYIGNCGFFSIDNDLESAELRIVIGEKKYWGRGFGNIIIDKMILIAKEKKFNSIWLSVSQNNERAIKLYKKCKFFVQNHNYKIVNNQPQIKMAYTIM